MFSVFRCTLSVTPPAYKREDHLYNPRSNTRKHEFKIKTKYGFWNELFLSTIQKPYNNTEKKRERLFFSFLLFNCTPYFTNIECVGKMLTQAPFSFIPIDFVVYLNFESAQRINFMHCVYEFLMVKPSSSRDEEHTPNINSLRVVQLFVRRATFMTHAKFTILLPDPNVML